MKLPVLVGRNSKVLFPGTVIRLQVAYPDSIALVEFIKNEPDQQVAFVTGVESSSLQINDFFLNEHGTLAKVLQIKRASFDSGYKYILIIEGISRIRLNEFSQTSPFIIGTAQVLTEESLDLNDLEAFKLFQSIKAQVSDLVKILESLNVPKLAISQLIHSMQNAPAGRLADLISGIISLPFETKLNLIKETSSKKRLQVLDANLKDQISLLTSKPKAVSGNSYISKLEQKLENCKLSTEASKVVETELQRLKKIPSSNAEHFVILNYLELIADLPWSVYTKDQLDICNARLKLDQGHFGMQQAKQRIVEYIAVRKLASTVKGPILCFVGSPGVGKTSLATLMAQALGRKFYRIALGGVRDEAEIRGHRRTYVGAMPGLILTGLKRAQVQNPVFLLDEIDKISKDGRGDPAAALLEVLDPEQNSVFVDRYLNIPFDLSQVLFIATANSTDQIPRALLDRMEVIKLSGYSYNEKVLIAKNHIIPKQLKAHGLQESQLILDESVIAKIATAYTREAGVRSLERQIAAICRNYALKYASGQPCSPTLDFESLGSILGLEKYQSQVSDRLNVPGVACGLAWTSDGSGDLLFVEATCMPGTGSLNLTGQLGSVIQESAKIALSWFRSHSLQLKQKGILSEVPILQKLDLHIHFPAGSIPKDGPSAGVTILIALISLFSESSTRQFLAMTGEMSLTGQVLAVGGIKEKVLAAHRGGIKRILLPSRNRKDLSQVPTEILNSLQVIFIESVWEAIESAFSSFRSAATPYPRL